MRYLPEAQFSAQFLRNLILLLDCQCGVPHKSRQVAVC